MKMPGNNARLDLTTMTPTKRFVLILLIRDFCIAARLSKYFQKAHSNKFQNHKLQKFAPKFYNQNLFSKQSIRQKMDGKNSENIIIRTLEIHTQSTRTVYHLKFYTKPFTYNLKNEFSLKTDMVITLKIIKFKALSPQRLLQSQFPENPQCEYSIPPKFLCQKS